MSARAAFGRICNPLRFQMIDDAPPLIAIRGQARALALPLVAIVGSRNASGAGLKFTQMIARELAAGEHRDRFRAAARHRRGGPRRKPRHRNDRGARRRPRAHLSAGT